MGEPPDVVFPASADEELYDGIFAVVTAVAATQGAVGWLHVPSRPEVDAWVDGVLARSARLAVLRRAGVVIALGYWARLDGAVLDRMAEIRKVMVHPDARGLGLGRAVVRALVADAAATGLEMLVLDVRGNNHAALGLYESLGFRAYGRLPDVIAVGDERFDWVRMYRDLRAGPVGLVRHGSRREGPGASG